MDAPIYNRSPKNEHHDGIHFMSPAKMGENRHVTPVYFCTFFERELAGLRARSLSQRKSSGRIAGAGRLKKVVAHKALKGGGDSEKRAREDQNWFNADLSQKLRFRESPPSDKWSE